MLHRFSGMSPEENQVFDELFKVTQRQIKEVNKKYK